MDEPRSFGELLRTHRLAAGLTQEALASRADLSVRGIADLERGNRRFPYVDTVRRLGNSLGLTPAQRDELLAAGRRPARAEQRAPTRANRNLVGYVPTANAVVGRVSELAALAGCLEEARAGRSTIALLGGVPGMGKSRIALEVSGVAARIGMTVLWGRCFEGEDARPLAPWVEALRGLLRELNRKQLRRRLAQHAATLAQILPNLRDVVPNLPARPSTSPDQDRLRLFDAVVHMVLAAAHQRPLLLVLDDLHWADRASLALLQHLARHTADAPLFILGTLREEELATNAALDDLIAALRREARFQHVTLPELSREESCALAASLLERPGQDEAPAELDGPLAHALLSHTAGNPLFIQEMVSDLIETGRIMHRQNQWTARSPTAEWEVPRGVRDVIDRRLRRLPASAQHLLEVACACTTGFTFADAQALTGAEEEALLESIDAALRRQLLRVVDQSAIPARYDFWHALIRQALYSRLNPDRRARLHLRTALALECGPLTDEQVVALATHYRLAGRLAAPERSIDYAVRAGEIAHASFAYEDAITHWQSALDLMELHSVDAERRAALLQKVGDELYITDQGGERPITVFEQALALYEHAGRSDALARIHLQLGRLFGGANSDRQNVPRAMHHARAAATLVPPNEVSMRHAQIESLFALTCFYSLKLDEALAASDRAMRIVAELENDAARVGVYAHRGFCLAAAGELAASQALMNDGYQIANRLNQPFFGALTTVWAGGARCDLLDPADACRWYATELAQPRTANSTASRQMLAFHAARARLMMGAVAEPTRDVPSGGVYHATLEAASAYVSGDWAACRAAATTVLDLARHRGNRWVEFWAVHQLARLAMAEEDATGAEDLLDRALELVAGQHRPWEALVNTDLGVLYASSGRINQARAALNRCRATMREGEDWRGLEGRLQLAEAALAVAERSTRGSEHFARAIAVFRRYHLRWEEAQALERWGATLIESGDRSAGDQRLDAAATLYRRHGAGPAWLQRVARIRAAAHNGGLPLRPERLSHREVEVLRLVAAGRSNQEIADALVLSVRTVERHLAHIYDKLGANGKSARAVAAAYGIANGLVPAPVL